MEQKIYFEDLSEKKDICHGSVMLGSGEHVSYVVTPAYEKAFLVLHIHDRSGRSIATHVASRGEIESLGEDKMALEEYSSYSSAFKTRGKKCDGKKIKRLFGSLPGRGDENSVQTKEEADVGKNESLVQQIQGLFKEESVCSGFDVNKFYKFEAIRNKDKEIITPILQISYYCVGGRHLLPDKTIWTKNNVLICSAEYVKTDIYKRFMYENVQKSTKMSFGLGLSMASPTPVNDIGPTIDEPVYSNGSPMTGAGGLPITFNFDYCETWARLRIEAELKIIEEAKAVICTSYPQ